MSAPRRYLQLRDLLKQPKGHCRWCGVPVTGRRRTWCSDACVAEYMLRASPARLRQALYRRDQGVCAICGSDTAALERELKQLKRTDSKAFDARLSGLKYQGFNVQWRSFRALWEADHRIEIRDGGDLGMDNLQTLCVPCHRRKTTERGKQIAISRRQGIS